jgi:signal transduction histidine kinase
MSYKATIFFGSIIFLIGCSQANAMQQQHDDPYPGINWYESFFKERTSEHAESAFKIAESDLAEAVAIQDLKAEAKLRKEIGLISLINLHDYERAMDEMVRALSIEDSLKMDEELVLTYLGISQIFEQVGDFNNSLEVLQQAMLMNEVSRDKEILVFIFNKIGKINGLKGETEAALENFEDALRLKDDISRPDLEAEATANLALLFIKQGDYNKALQTHKEALFIRREIGDQKNEAQSLNDIGELYRLMKNDDKALANYLVALEIRQKLDDKAGIAETHNNIGSLYYEQKDFEKSIHHLKLGLEAAQDAQVQEQLKKSYDLLSHCYKNTGDFQKALEFRDLYLAIVEFIQNEKNEQRIAETRNQYLINKKQSEIDKLETIREKREKEIRDQKQFRNFLFSIIGLGFVIVLLVLYLYIVKQRSNKMLVVANRKVQQQNQTLQELNATKDKFFSIISHDLKGPLNSLTSFSSLLINHTDSLSKDEIKLLANDLDKSLKNLFALLDNLLEWSRSQTGNIEFRPEVFNITQLLEQNKALLALQAQNKKITLQQLCSQNFNVNAHKNSVTTVIRNLISNAIKFTPANGTIALNALQKNDKVVISVKDTGVGMDAEVIKKLFRIDSKHTTRGTADEKGTGLGLILCKDFIEKNSGEIWVESTPGKGSIFYFSLPAAISPSVIPEKSAIGGLSNS